MKSLYYTTHANQFTLHITTLITTIAREGNTIHITPRLCKLCKKLQLKEIVILIEKWNYKKHQT